MGLTDTDDALAEVRANRPVQIYFLESGADEMGALFIPNTVSLVKGAPHPELGKRLIDYLLSPAVESRLAQGPSGQIPRHPAATAHPDLDLSSIQKSFPVDFRRAAEAWEPAMTFVKEQFTSP